MRSRALFVLAIALLLPCVSFAIPTHNLSFESGDLDGWEHAGDVSVQTAALGVIPTDGRFAALLTTLGNSDKPNSFSGSDALNSSGFLDWFGVTLEDLLHAGNMPLIELGAHVGLRTSFTMRAGDILNFDWNRVGDSWDRAIVLFYDSTGSFWDGEYADLHMFNQVSNMDLGIPDPDFCGRPEVTLCDFESGWQTSAFVAPRTSNFTLVFAMREAPDPLGASALWVDRVQILRVPEPGTLALLALGLLPFGLNVLRLETEQGSSRSAR